MKTSDIVKGVNALRLIAKNLCSLTEYSEHNQLDEIIPNIDEMNFCCAILTDLFENEFLDLVRTEDDGK